MRLLIESLLLVTIASMAMRFAGRPERAIAWTLLGAFGAGVAKLAAVGPASFRTADFFNFFLEFATCAIMIAVALRANRVWPLWVAGFQIIICSAHVSAALGAKALPGVYWATTTLPTFLQIFVLCLAITAQWRRERGGWTPDWRWA